MAEPRPAVGAFQASWQAGEPTATPRTDVARASAGDRAAFDRIIDARLEPTFRTALAILGDEADARDACQEAFIAAWRDLPRLREPERFDAWFGRILVNACRDGLRSRRRRHVREIDVDEASRAALPSRGRPVDERIAARDALERAFERLSVAERTILALHHLEHRPLTEISGILGIPEGTVKSRLHAARRSFERAWR